MAVALTALPTMTQNFSKQEQPVFQSTSTMTPSGSAYSAQPALNADGTAYSPVAQAPIGPRRAPNPINDDNDWEDRKEKIGTGVDTPVGDPVLPLLLFAGAYLAWNLFFRRKRAEER